MINKKQVTYRDHKPDNDMSTLTAYSPFDVLIRNFFDTENTFFPATQNKVGHPVDIYEDDEGLHVLVACTGIDKKDIEVITEGDTLRVRYEKPAEERVETRNYYTQGIAKRSFNIGYKVASRFDLSRADGAFENGLLQVDIPFSKSAAPSRLKIR